MKKFIAIQKVWDRVSADYDAQHRYRARIVAADTTAKELMEWGECNAWGKGDVVLVRDDSPMKTEALGELGDD